ncbi:MAG: SWIM zinc finger family protein [Selenomonadaceae bacterium]|nr:SWIM zinc finger family protein [Selenomonadaceae bacterium]
MTFFDPENSELHSDPDQLTRQKNARRLNVQSIDYAASSGIINGYEVSLTKCSCIDFSRRRKPCKHMYRLAHELEIFSLDGEVINDPTVKNWKEQQLERYPLSEKFQGCSTIEKQIARECYNLRKLLIENPNVIEDFEKTGILSLKIDGEKICFEFKNLVET